MLVCRRREGDEGGGLWRAMAGAIPAGLTLGVYAALRLTVLDFGSDSQASTSGLGQRLVEVGQALFLYVKMLFIPASLHMERSLDGASGWMAVGGYGLLVFFGALVIVGYRRRHWRLSAASAWFLLTWFPISGIFALNAPLAEHWMYVPSAGFFWCLAEAMWMARPSKNGMAVMMAPAYVFCLFLLSTSIHQNKVWVDNGILYSTILEHNPDSLRANFNLAATYEDILDNDAGARRHYERTLGVYREKKSKASPQGAEQFWDQELEAHLSLGRISVRAQRPENAVQHFGLVLRVQPTDNTVGVIGMAALGMGELLMEMGNYAGAARVFAQGRSAYPASAFMSNEALMVIYTALDEGKK